MVFANLVFNFLRFTWRNHELVQVEHQVLVI